MNRIIKSIAFNQNDPFERELWEHSQQYSQFSAYVKRLIQRDKDGAPKESAQTKTENLANDDNKNAMQSFL